MVLLVSARPAFKSFDDVLLLPKLYRDNLASGTSLMMFLPRRWLGRANNVLSGSGRRRLSDLPKTTKHSVWNVSTFVPTPQLRP